MLELPICKTHPGGGGFTTIFFTIFLILESFWKLSASSNQVVFGDIAIYKSKFHYIRPFNYLSLIFFQLLKLWIKFHDFCFELKCTMTADRVQSFKSLSTYLALLWLIMCFGGILPVQGISLDYIICIRSTAYIFCNIFLVSQPNSVLFSATDSWIFSHFSGARLFMLTVL